ncbi:hypothetical protein L596_015151 [Steinernema carpocapsae]|uniref:Uncharacterized protein n=1 Tax=Steinernema carpocapsae TaxID=34508 RepID=A0A4U5NEC2_STECR|nr:hypothetical protein L596_015151 [Steinernema carpocapsae]
MASTDSEKERHENAAVAAFEEKSQALGGYKSNFKKLKALFTNNEGNAAIQLANNLPATIADIILPEDQSGMINSFREVLVEPESTIPTSSRLEVEGQQRIIRRWSDATPQNLDKIITNFLHDPENTRMDSFWESAESVTLTDRKKLFYGSCLTVLAYIIVFNLSRVACNFVVS